MIKDEVRLLVSFLNKYEVNLPNEILERIQPLFSVVQIRQNETLVYMGERSSKLYFVISGILRSYFLDIDGNDKTHYFIQEGNVCCVDGFIEVQSIHTCIEALKDCTLLAINYTDVRNVIDSCPEVKELWIKALEESLAYKIKRENAFLIQSATERYINFTREYQQLEKRVNQKYIASYLGITPVSLSRIRRTIREEN